jgi:cysteine desulfurase
MGLGSDMARAAIRVSLGPQTSEGDIAAFLAAWEKVAKPAAIAA